MSTDLETTSTAGGATVAASAPPAVPEHEFETSAVDEPTAGSSQADDYASFEHNKLQVPAEPLIAVSTSAATAANGGAGTVTVTALANDLQYTLTIGQALDAFAAAHRKVPSERSMQRYCTEGPIFTNGQVAAKKIRTSYGSEWLINETSLAALIAAQPQISVVAAAANNNHTPPMAAPVSQASFISAPVSNVIAAVGDAGAAVTPPLAAPEGERRSIADVLIENARLFAQVEGKDEIIAELKEDKGFLREEVREARKTRDDVKNIAERMLDTLKTMAIGRLAAAPSPDEPLRAAFVDHTQHRSG